MEFLHYANTIYQYSLELFLTAPFMMIWWCFAAIYILVTLPNFFLKKPLFSGFILLSDFFALLISGAVCSLSISFHHNFWWLFFAFQLSWIGFFIYIGSLMDRVYPNSDGAMVYIIIFYPWMLTSPLAVLIHVVYKYVLGY